MGFYHYNRARRTPLHLVGCVVVVVVVLWLPSLLLANGGFKAVPAIPANPGIPVQRALIACRDGTETLVVESTFDTPSDRVGWILPLPAEPTRLAAADPGLLRSMSMSLRPVIERDSKGIVALGVVLFGFTCIGAYAAYDAKRRFSLLRVALVLMILFCLVSVLLPTLGRAAESIDGVRLASSRAVGNYDVSVLRAASAADLNRWLAEAGLAGLAPDERSIVDDYVRRHWCFVVAQLRHDAAGPATPHPIAATFPLSASPVFPMKLTRVANTTTRVELFVVANGRAAATGFHCGAADAFTPVPASAAGPSVDVGPTFVATHNKTVIGNPDAGDFLWDGAVVTRLTADLAPAQMDHDVDLSLSDLVPHRDRFYTTDVRRDRAIGYALAAACVPAAWLGIVRRGGRPLQSPDRTLLWAFVAACPVAAIAAFLLTPVTPSRPVRGGVVGPMLAIRQMVGAVSDLAERGQLNEATTVEQLAGSRDLLARITGGARNPFTNEPIAVDRTPGNVSIRRTDGATYFCAYDIDGREHRVKLPPATRPATAPSRGPEAPPLASTD